MSIINLCEINQNLGGGEDCAFSFGGIDTTIYVGNKGDSEWSGTAGTNGEYEVTGLTGNWYEYATLEEGFANQSLTVNGRSRAIEQVISFAFSAGEITPSAIAQFEAILKSKKGFQIIVKMKASQKYYIYGATNKLTASTFTWESGAAETDENVVNFELTGLSNSMAWEVSEAAVEALIAP
jgi:hypothetical protein